MNDFQYTNSEKAAMFDHWWRGRLSNDELREYREAWHGRTADEREARAATRRAEVEENNKVAEKIMAEMGW